MGVASGVRYVARRGLGRYTRQQYRAMFWAMKYGSKYAMAKALRSRHLYIRKELGRTIRDIQIRKPLQKSLIHFEHYLDDVIHNQSYQAAAAVNKRLQDWIRGARRHVQERFLTGQTDL